jgi:2-oxoglutarate decarboxylase
MPTRPKETGDALGAFGPNAWLVDEMYEQYRKDPASVSESWRDFFADYRRADTTEASGSTPRAPAAPAGAPAEVPDAAPAAPLGAAPGAAPEGRVALAPEGTAAARPPGEAARPAGPGEAGAEVLPLRGASARAVSNMEASLEIPTATSVREVPAKLLELNRTVLNNHLSRHSGGKVSFTHLIGFAVVRAMQSMPVMKSTFVPDADGRGTPGVARHDHVGLGLAVDVEKPDGSRTLLVPCIKEAEKLDFRAFLLAYEDLVRKVRNSRVTADDFTGTTATLTNPGTIGTVHSVPRLMPGQSVIVGVGALDYPAEYQAADRSVLAHLGLSKVITLTSTYDHRVIQGAESGMFLAKIHDLLLGADGFYDEVFHAMGVPYEPVRWRRDTNPVDQDRSHLAKAVHVQTLINMYRVRGHLIAHLDPLDMREPRLHPELDPLTYGLTLWDLDREFFTDGLAGKDVLTLGEILGILRDAYCRTVGIEYMHIQDPVQKEWIQARVEGVSDEMSYEDKLHILGRLNAAEAFERFLHTRYIGQKRFGLEGAESAIPLLDAILEEAVAEGLEETVMGMAHRGRLNVLANIVGQSYEEIFREFEGDADPESVEGSGDVRYHKGATGKFVSRGGGGIQVTLASNPSHLEAVDPVVEGMARARCDVLGRDGDVPVLPLLVHGDAAFAGQGVVAETLNLSALRGYQNGGTVHLVINNQLGFTTAAESARSSFYPTDVAKMVQAPIFHVNGDDPEACVRVGRLAFAFRQAFHKDVVIDMVCYRLHGHNETDEPSYTQPLMYKRIEQKRSVRKLYTETLVNRGDITLEDAESALDDFSRRLQAALDETRSNAPPQMTELPAREPVAPLPPVETGVSREVLDGIARALHRAPEGFHVHPKLARLLEARLQMYESGQVDWSLAEALAMGSILLDGNDVRLTGQDTRRGTFSQRHSTLADFETGEEYAPLANLPHQGKVGRFFAFDSLLSEYAALGYEYGYSVAREDALVAWEAQFGDFINAAQVIVDQFIVAAEEKWGQSSGLVLLLPHGYEGQGPEHSSARLERFLTESAGGNLWVVQPTTAAQYFHLLRAQVLRAVRRPLVVMTPKSLLRSRSSRSGVEELTGGHFREVIDDPGADPASVSRIVMCSGKVAFQAMQRRSELKDPVAPSIAVVRLEQLYPWPAEEVAGILARYPGAKEVLWLQEEPENMGAWAYVHARLHRLLRDEYQLSHVSRAESGSPATGSPRIHQLESEDLLRRAIG